MNQDPVADSDRVRPGREQRDVDVPAHSRHLDLRDVVLGIDDLDDLTRDP
ncbi:hypothetical protein BH18ACT13_BH18ACT13_18650 [soil metagenome]